MGKRKGKKRLEEKPASFRTKVTDRAETFYRSHRRAVDAAALLLLFLACFFVRLNNISHKTELHSDEVFSMMLCSCNPYYNGAIPDGTYSGAELKQMVAVHGDAGVGGAAEDIAHLWRNNSDSPHASLYYMALRIALIGYDSFDVHDFSMRGGILNLVFFSLSFFFMYKLLRRIFGDRILLILSGLTVAFLNLLSIQNTMLVREYQMAETFVILLTWVTVCFVQRLRGGDAPEWRRYVPAFAFAIGCVISLGYFNSFYVIAVGLCLVAVCWRQGYKKGVWFVLLSGVAGLAVALVLYPGFFNFILYPTVHKSMAFRNFPLAASTVFARDIPRYLFLSYGVWIIAAVFVVGMLSKNGVRNLLRGPYFVWLPLAALVCTPLILYASVLKHPRYYYSLLPTMTLLVPQMLTVMSALWRRYFSLLIILFFPVLTSQVVFSTRYGWRYLSAELDKPVVFYRLNPNELVQLVPSLDDKVEYTVANSRPLEDLVKENESRAVVSKLGKWTDDKLAHVGRVIWNKNIYLFEVKHVPEEKE